MPPSLTLDLRVDDEGGPLRATVLQGGTPRSVVTVLVHGFNNHRGDALDAYANFRLNQNELLPSPPPPLHEMWSAVFWPGDAAWGAFDLADFLVYPSAVKTARKAAPILARHIASIPGVRIVHFVGHSLGCRVILETINELLSISSRPFIGKVALMAAAVPVFKLKGGNRGTLRRALLYPQDVLMLYSGADIVLHYAFPPGQGLAKGDEGFLPKALGRHGIPDSVRPGSVEVPGAGHSDYWPAERNRKSKPQAKAATLINQFFGWSDTRIVGDRIAAPAVEVGSRDLPAARPIKARLVA